MKNKYLFILCPPASGSTLLWKILKTSPHVSAFPGEGKGLVKSILFTKDRWNPDKVIPWKNVKNIWEKHWDLTQPVLLEKSPPHLVRAKQLETHFPGSYFIIMIRNPYAFCEGVKRRWGKNFSYFNIAKFWVSCAKYQVDNIKYLKNNIYLTYEELTDQPEQTCKQIIRFVPEVEVLSPAKKFDVFEKSMNISNLDEKQISNLTPGDIFEINEVLKKYPDLLTHFNYQYLEPAERVSFKVLRKIHMRIRPGDCPGPERWQNWKKLN